MTEVNESKREKSAEAVKTVKVRFKGKSYKIDKGEEREVDKATADQLVADGHAVVVK